MKKPNSKWALTLVQTNNLQDEGPGMVRQIASQRLVR